MKIYNKNKFFILIGLIFLVSGVFASCEDNQININTASSTELDKLTGIGPAKAAEIINSRPFESIDDLLNVKGIGETTLQNIKQQGLACIDKESVETNNEETNNEEDQSTEEELSNVPEEDSQAEEAQTAEKTELTQNTAPAIVTAEVIKLDSLDSKSIKTQTSSENSSNKYAIYGLVFFCILLLGLFVIRWKKIFSKNEFK